MTKIEDIKIRHELVPGDLGYVTYLHGILYAAEYGHGIQCESYIAAGLLEFYEKHGFKLTEEKESTAFGKPLREQRYDLFIDNKGEIK